MAYKFSKGNRGFGDITFEGDADTGIDFENDTIKLETNGSERLIIANSNIQSNEPIKIKAASTSGSPLDIEWHGMDGTAGASTNAIHISHKRVTNSTRTTSVAFSKWYNNGSSDTSIVFGMVGADATGTWNNNASSRVGCLNFKLVDPANNGSITERMRIATDGNVGIGTTSPTVALHVAAEDPRVRVDATAGNHPGFELAEAGTRKWLIFNDPANDNLVFKDSADRVVIKQGGNVGIGTDNPASHLHIKDTGDVVITLEADSDNVDENDNAYIEFKQDAANTRGIIGTCGATNKGPDGTTFTGAIANSLLVGTHYATYNGSHYMTPLQFACEGLVQMTIYNGDVGIGVNVPTAKLDVNSNTMRLRSSRTIASDSSSGDQGEICWDSNYIYICVASNTWKRVAISSW